MTTPTTAAAQLHARGIPTRTFATTLQALRLRAGYSQGELARLSGIEPSAISRLEAGNRNPSHGLVLRIAATLMLSQPDCAWLECSAGYLPSSVSAADVVALVERGQG